MANADRQNMNVTARSLLVVYNIGYINLLKELVYNRLQGQGQKVSDPSAWYRWPHITAGRFKRQESCYIAVAVQKFLL
jgi:hypothetical protein